MTAKQERDLTCPHCNRRIHLSQLQASEALINYLQLLLNLDRPLSSALQTYIDLWRVKDELTNEKKLRIAEEVLALHPDHGVLLAALHATIDGAYTKQQAGTFRPYKDLSYFKAILNDTAAKYIQQPQRMMMQPTALQRPAAVTSKAVATVLSLEGLRGKYRDDE